MATENLRDYFRTQQVSPQWLAVLRAMAPEMMAFAGAKGLHGLFFNIGQRYASEPVSQFSAVNTLEELEQRLNVFWLEQNWGWVRLVEAKDGIDIAHQAAPLAAAFGDESLQWSVGLLEGFYQAVFAVLGASDQMVVRNAGIGADGMDIHLRLGF